MRHLGALLMSQLRLVPAILRWVTRRKAMPAGADVIPSGKQDRQMLAMVVALTVVEAFVVGLLFHGFSAMVYIDIAQWWMAVTMLGLYAGTVVYPQFVTDREVVLRRRTSPVRLPLEQIRDVRWNPLPNRPDDGSLFLPAPKQGTQLTFELDPPLRFEDRAVTAVHASTDDPTVVDRIRAALGTKAG